jgi:hypothetical protein
MTVVEGGSSLRAHVSAVFVLNLFVIAGATQARTIPGEVPLPMLRPEARQNQG